FALRRAAFQLAAGIRCGDPIGSSISGARVVRGRRAGGYSRSIIPGPVQLLSEQSMASSIGRSLVFWLSVGAWPIAYRGNAATQVRRVGAAGRGSSAERSRQVSLTRALTSTYVRAAMIARRLLVSTALAWPGVALAQA